MVSVPGPRLADDADPSPSLDATEADGRPARLGIDAGRTITTPRWSMTPRRTRRWRDFTLWIVDSGEGTFYGQDLQIPLERGSCLLMPGQRDYTITRDPNLGLDHFYLHFDYVDDDLQPIPLSQFGRFPPIYRRFDDYEFVRGLIMRVLSYTVGSPSLRPKADCLLNALLSEVAQQDAQAMALGRDRDRLESLQRLCEQIRHHPEERYVVGEMAEDLGWTPSHFCRMFKQHVGCSPQQFILDARMATARHLLRDSGHSITHIADLLGYRDVAFFSRQFSQHHGTSPSGFRSRRPTPAP